MFSLSGPRAACGVALALLLATVGAGSSQAAVPLLSSVVGPHCTVTADAPVAGETTLTDSTIPTLTSVSWAHTTVVAKAKATVRVTIKLSDDCSGAGDVMLQLHNATTGATGYFGATYVSSTITSAAIHDTWIVDVPLHGTDAGSISVVHVAFTTGFTSLVYTTKPSPTVNDIVDMLPHDDQVTDADYHDRTPAHATKIAVKASTSLTADAAPEPVKHGRTITVKATLKELKTSAYAGLGLKHVTLEYKAPGGSWHALKNATTSRSGLASATYKPAKAGTYSFRAVFAGSTYVAAVTSPVDTVKVT